jgi:hypothetical protein
MTEMSQEELIAQLTELSILILSAREEIEREHEKLQVALAAVFRLLSGEKGSTADKIHADPDRLKGYLIRLVSQLHQNSDSLCDSLKSRVDSIMKAARNP